MLALLFSLIARAQPSPPSPVQPATTAASETSGNNQTPPSGEIDVNGGYSFDGHQDFSGPSVHGSFSPRNSFNRWNAGVARTQQFGISGQIFEGGIDRDLTNTWGGGLSISGSNALFLPQLAADVSANKRWLAKKKFATSFSGGYVRWQDVHRDYHWGLGASYHFQRPWGVEAGVNIDLSTPTNQCTETQYVAVSHGRVKNLSVGLRGDFGRVAYQITGPNTSISNFESYGISLQVRQWVGSNWGFVVSGSYSYNSVYQSEGVSLGFFKGFSGSSHSTSRNSGR